jgi:hypothetical protein
VVGKGKDRHYVPIDLGRLGRRSKEEFTGPFYLRYGVKYESVGQDFKTAVEAMQRRQATLDAQGRGVEIKQVGDPDRKRVVDEVKKFLAKKSLLQDPKTAKTLLRDQGWDVADNFPVRLRSGMFSEGAHEYQRKANLFAATLRISRNRRPAR